MRSIYFWLGLTLSGGPVFSQTKHLTAEALWQLGRVSLQDVNQEGQQVIYGVTTYDQVANKGNTDLWLISSQGGTAVQLTNTPEHEGNARFVPGSALIAYLKNDQLWVCSLTGANARQFSEEEMTGFVFSRDGKTLVYTREVAYDKGLKDQHPDLAKANARRYDDLMYRHWQEWEDGSYSNVFFAPFQQNGLGAATNICPEPFDAPLKPFGGIEQIAVSPNGRYIAYTSKKMKGSVKAQSTNSDIYLYDREKGSTLNITKANPGYDIDPTFSPDGSTIAWNSMARDGYEADRQRIFVMPVGGENARELTVGFDREANGPQWSADGKELYFITGEAATYQLAVVDLSTTKIRTVTSGVHDYVEFKVLDQGRLVGKKGSMSMPHELYTVDIKSGKETALTTINSDALASIKMGQVKERWVTTTDKKKMKVWMVYPPDFDPTKKYPTLLYCQGGPQSAVSQFWSYRWNFQLMAANGYIVVAPNRRGLPSFGSAWNEEISKNYGGQAMKDLLSAIDDAAKEPYVDKNKLGAVGASFGGYSVYWLAGNHNKRFKSFISHCGMFNMESWYNTTEELFFANWDVGGPAWNTPAPASYMSSPHKFVKNWDTPIMIIHGEQDFRVPLQEGLQAFQAARLKGLKSRLLTFPSEGHWVNNCQNSILWQREFFQWLDETLKNPGTGTSTKQP